MQSLGKQLKIDDIPLKVINILKELDGKDRKQLIDLTKIGESLQKILFSFQKESVRYIDFLYTLLSLVSVALPRSFCCMGEGGGGRYKSQLNKIC